MELENSMTQREQVLAAVVSGATRVTEIQAMTGIGHPGTVRRELVALRESGKVVANRTLGSATLWAAISYTGLCPINGTTIAEPAPGPDSGEVNAPVASGGGWGGYDMSQE
jgi:hypothetical protein